jgi:hypothetical protein
LLGSGLAFLNVLAQYFGVHAAGPNNAQPPGIAYGTGQPPAAGPDHACLYNGVINIKKLRYSILKHKRNMQISKDANMQLCCLFTDAMMRQLIVK